MNALVESSKQSLIAPKSTNLRHCLQLYKLSQAWFNGRIYYNGCPHISKSGTTAEKLGLCPQQHENFKVR